MPLLYVVLVLLAVGIGLWVINTKVGFIDANIKSIINAVVIIAVIVWLMKVFGIWQYLSAVKVG